jgi:signal transduction histidine kinase
MEKARDLVDLTLAEARSAISGLRPPVLDDFGLAGGLASLAASIPEVDLQLDLADDRLPEHIEVALYRIAQECAQNVVKHSRALVATVTFTVADRVARLEVADNGVGFEVVAGTRAAGYGMLSMAERAELVGGSLVVRSRPGGGTTVMVSVPVDDGKRPA